MLASFGASISHWQYFHNRAAPSSLPMLDLGFQCKQVWVKPRGGVDNKLDSARAKGFREDKHGGSGND